MSIQIRPLDAGSLETVARIWDEGWQDGHAAIVPAALCALRTHASFRARLRARMDRSFVACAGSDLLGFSIIEADQIYQFYVDRAARGQGVAGALMGDALARIAAAGHVRAWLSCSVGNDRAARFYEKSGWQNICEEIIQVETTSGPFPLPVWRFEIALSGAERP